MNPKLHAKKLDSEPCDRNIYSWELATKKSKKKKKASVSSQTSKSTSSEPPLSRKNSAAKQTRKSQRIARVDSPANNISDMQFRTWGAEPRTDHQIGLQYRYT